MITNEKPPIKQCLANPQSNFPLDYVLSPTSYGVEYNFGQLMSVVPLLDLPNFFFCILSLLIGRALWVAEKALTIPVLLYIIKTTLC